MTLVTNKHHKLSPDSWNDFPMVTGNGVALYFVSISQSRRFVKFTKVREQFGTACFVRIYQTV